MKEQLHLNKNNHNFRNSLLMINPDFSILENNAFITLNLYS